MALSRSLVAGGAGSLAVNGIHQIAKEHLRSAPRVDIVGMRAIRRMAKKLGLGRLSRRQQFDAALAGDLISNGIFYSFAASGRAERPLLRGAFLGVAAGLGAVFLTPSLGLGRAPVKRTPATAIQTFTWYLLGGLVAGITGHLLSAEPRQQMPV